MAAYQPARGRARAENIQEFMARRAREVASFGRAAEAAAYAGVKKAIRAGQDYRLMTPGEVMAYGGSLMRRGQTQAAASPAARRSSPAKPRGLDDNEVAKAAGGTAAYVAGLVPGAARGAVHMGAGVADGVMFAHRLANPLDPLLSPPGESARAQVNQMGAWAADQIRRRVEDPSILRRDIESAARDFRVKHDPTATPVADTVGGEMKRAFELGMNGGELVFDGASLFVGGAALRGAAGVGQAAKAATATERAYLAAHPGTAARFGQPYPKRGMSHHIVNRAAKRPRWLGGGRYPNWLIESEFNKIRHDPGMSTRDVYRNHVGVGGPRHFRGGAIGRDFGGGVWSAGDLGWDTYGRLDRLNYGTSPVTKAVVGPILVGGVASDGLRPEETP